MSVKVIRALLVASDSVLALVPAARIVSGTVREGTTLPALGLTEVSSIPIGAIDGQSEYSVVVSRIQVTVMSKTYADLKAIIDVVRRACNFQYGEIAGIRVISTVRDTIGPDIADDAGNCFQSIDFKVTFHEQN